MAPSTECYFSGQANGGPEYDWQMSPIYNVQYLNQSV